MPIALVFGATGLVGQQITLQLLADPRYERVHTFGRRPVGLSSPKLEEHTIQFDQPATWADQVRGDHVFLALGTTRKAAGTLEDQRRIDVDYGLYAAKAAREGGATAAALVSSAGASARSTVPYNRMKGDLEDGLRALGFAHLALIRPGILEGERIEARHGERLGIALLRPLRFVPGLKAWSPIPATTVARACIRALNDPKAPAERIAQLGGVFELGAEAG